MLYVIYKLVSQQLFSQEKHDEKQLKTIELETEKKKLITKNT